jgi:hypothetical protein
VNSIQRWRTGSLQSPGLSDEPSFRDSLRWNASRAYTWIHVFTRAMIYGVLSPIETRLDKLAWSGPCSKSKFPQFLFLAQTRSTPWRWDGAGTGWQTTRIEATTLLNMGSAPLNKRVSLKAETRMQPVALAIPLAGTQINQDGEQTVGDADGAVGDRPGHGAAARTDGKKRKLQIVAATGRIVAIVQLPLVGEGGALGCSRMQAGAHCQDGEQKNQFCSHGMVDCFKFLPGWRFPWRKEPMHPHQSVRNFEVKKEIISKKDVRNAPISTNRCSRWNKQTQRKAGNQVNAGRWANSREARLALTREENDFTDNASPLVVCR